ncbi:hypothetical protein OK59_24400 [Salmonella enterica subsp. enterica]|nr:hypothetical protein [Salmonella enterica subsp. enterica serovar Lexington]
MPFIVSSSPETQPGEARISFKFTVPVVRIQEDGHRLQLATGANEICGFTVSYCKSRDKDFVEDF